MSDTFDPYRKWLGVPPAEQPPNHYRLLGVGLFEDDADTILSAADRQMGHVRTFQTGPHSAISQKLLNELAAAKICLLDAKKRTEYDYQLRKTLAAEARGAAGQGDGAVKASGVEQGREVMQGRGGAEAEALANASREVTPAPQPAPKRAAPAPIFLGQGRGGASQASLQETAASAKPAPEMSAIDRRHIHRGRRRRQSTAMVGVGATLALFVGAYFMRPTFRPAALRPATTDDLKAEPQTSRTGSVARASDAPDKPQGAGVGLTPGEGTAAPLPSLGDSPNESAQQPESMSAVSVGATPTPDVPAPDEPAPERPSPIGPRSLADLAAVADRPALAETHRDAPPEGRALKTAELRFGQLFQGEIARARSVDASRKVALKLFRLAREGDQSPDVRYVMLRQVGQSGAAQGSVGLAYGAAAEAARQFEVDPLSIKLEALEAAARNAQTPAANAIGALQALALSDRAASQGKIELANRSAAQAAIFARKTKDKDLAAQAGRRKAALREHSKRRAEYAKAVADLKANSHDQQANLAAGKYDALALGDWATGLPRLAKSGQAELVAIAHLEAAARLDSSQWAPLSEAWRRASQQEDDFWKPRFERQAKYCYLRARQQGRAGGVSAEAAEQMKNVLGYPLSRLRAGAAARFYEGADFQRQRAERADPLIDFFFGDGSPDPSVPTNFFSARWTGFLKPPIAGRYRIVTFTNDSVRLWIDGEQVLNRWGRNAQWQQVELELSDEPHTVRLEYNETFAEAVVLFGWSLAAFSDEQRLQWSPIDALYYDPDSPFDLPDF